MTDQHLTRRAVLVGLTLTAVPAVLNGFDARPAAAVSGSGSGLDREALRATLDAVPLAGMPGIFARVHDGRHSWAGAAGVADVTTGAPTTPMMRHRVGSITKSFVATTLLQLVGERRLRLDDPVERWLPGLLPDGRHITVRMLLNHTSGIGEYTNALFREILSIEDLDRFRATTFAPRELVAAGVGEPVTGAPGERFSYSNTNYIVAGLILERVTGRPAPVEVTRRILRPLGLADTYFPGTEKRIRGPHAAAYYAPIGFLDLVDFNMSWAWMAGELVSTTSDLNRFFRALLGGNLLRPTELAAMKTTVPFIPEAPELAGYGLGLFWSLSPCGPAWGHDGGTLGHITTSVHTVDGRRGVTAAMNMSHYQTGPDAHPIDLALGEFLTVAFCGVAPGARAQAAASAIARRPLGGDLVPPGTTVR